MDGEGGCSSEDQKGVRLMVVRFREPDPQPPALVECLPDLPRTARVWALVLEDASFPLTIAGQGMLPEWPLAIERITPSIRILPDDTAFPDSAAAGELLCYCSRCGEWIDAQTRPIRCPSAAGDYWEYRYHPHCVGIDDL